MLATYKATLKGDQLQWQEDNSRPPSLTQPVDVLVTILEKPAPGVANERGRRMADALRHRGPDDAGVWVDAAAGIALGHRRLCIIDLSPAGHQPMASACGRYVANYNGELYNFRAMRREFEALPAGSAPAFRGHCDTEDTLRF